MKLPFWKKQEAKRELAAELEREAIQTHQKNIETIQSTKRKVDTLNTVLKENNIIFQLAHVIGHTK